MKSNIAHSKYMADHNPFVYGWKTTAVARVVTVLLALLVLYPLLFIVLVSFKNNMEFYQNIWGVPAVWRFENYARAWVTGNIGLFARNSVLVTVIAVLGSVLLSTLAGYALSKMHIPFADGIVGILMVLSFVPGIAVYISLYIQMIAMSLNKTLLMLILPYTAWQLPFSIYIFKRFFDSVSKELLEAARVDGCSEMVTFARIVLPLVKPAIATVTVFNFITIWGEYLWASICSSSSTKIQTLPVGLLYFKGEYGIEWGLFAAAITIIVIPLICVFIYFQRFFIQGLTAGAVKG